MRHQLRPSLLFIKTENPGKPELPAVEPKLPAVKEEVRSASVIDRRQFLIRLGAATATITVLGGGLGAILAQNERRQLDRAVAT